MTCVCVCVCVCVSERERGGATGGSSLTAGADGRETRGRADGRGINHIPEAVPKAAVPRQSLRPPLRPCKI